MGWKIGDKPTVTPLDADFVLMEQGGNTRNTTWKKLKDFFLGTETLTTTAQTVKGAIQEIKGNVDSNTTSLSDKVNNSDVVTVATANKILKLDSNKKLPTSITGDADSVDGIQGTQIALKTTSDLTFYINPTSGLDTNNGYTSGTAFKTIQKALSLIPQIVNHTVTINLASGYYNESITLYGYSGSGGIGIYGDSIASANYKINGLYCKQCNCNVYIRGLYINTNSAISILGCLYTNIDFCQTDATASEGVHVENSIFGISNSIVSNKTTGIIAYHAIIFSNTNSGVTNGSVLFSAQGSTIAKNGTQPTGTTAEVINAGGVIR